MTTNPDTEQLTGMRRRAYVASWLRRSGVGTNTDATVGTTTPRIRSADRPKGQRPDCSKRYSINIIPRTKRGIMKEERFGQFPRTAVDFSIVVPFFNEVDNIRPLYESIVKVMDALGQAYEMVFVDDGSRDGSYKILREISDRDARVALIRLRRNFGQTAALKAGFDYTHGEIIVSMDGDLQHDPTEIPQFINKILEGYDIVSGWRVDRKDAWLTRRIPSRIANRVMAKLSRVDLHDFGTTSKAYGP